MEWFNKIKANLPQVLKIGGLIVGGLLVLLLLLSLTGSTFNVLRGKTGFSQAGYLSDSLSLSKGGAMMEATSDSFGIGLSARNAASSPSYDNGVNIGNTSEDFEVTEYTASIESRDIKNTCAQIAGLKKLDYVIFENAREYDKSCNYYFKVEKEYRAEILDIINKLDPKDLSENIRTIKSQIDDFTSEEEILKNKMATIELTLNDALNAYDEITRVATQARDSESLARIINSKIQILERLTKEKIAITEQLDRMSRAKAQQLDRLDYAYFSVNAYENKFIDSENLKDSWKAAVKKFVRDTNQVLQALSINFVLLLLLIIQYGLYLLLILLALKYGWGIAKRIWGSSIKN
jgi:hypothetical protein